ncbi:hypothetical protein [Ureibacillus acetophenoni]
MFAFLYYKTKRLLTSIIAHMLLNSFVTIIQIFYDDLMRIMKEVQMITFLP